MENTSRVMIDLLSKGSKLGSARLLRPRGGTTSCYRFGGRQEGQTGVWATPAAQPLS